VKIQAIHTVGPGDIMRKVAEKYGVSKQAIMDANHKKDDITLRGEVLIIPLKK
jgi:LysM repeat protein